MILGIDPGKDGAFVVLNNEGIHAKMVMPTCKVQSGKKVKTAIDIEEASKFFEHWKDRVEMAFLEEVHAIFGSSAGATFEFGKGVGVVEGLLVAYEIPYQKVKPVVWQRKMFEGIPEIKKPNGRRDTKQMAYLACKSLWPYIDLTKSERATTPHDGIVDAMLIGSYGL